MELVFWQSAEKTNTAQSYREYLKSFPNGVFAGLANERLRLLSGVITKTPPKAPKVQPKKVETQIAALPPQTSVPAPRSLSSGNGGSLHVTAKISGTTSCDAVPSGFEGDIDITGGSFQGIIESSSGYNINLKGSIRGSSLELDGKIGGGKADRHGAATWYFDTNASEKMPGVYQTKFSTTRNYVSCGLRVTLSLKRNN